MQNKPQYNDLLTEGFFIKHYVEGRMSYPAIAEMLRLKGMNIPVGTLHRYARRLGIGRSRSQAKRNREENPLNYDMSYLTASTVEAVDGFLLGDGGINVDPRSAGQVARLACGVEYEEFSRYLIDPFQRYNAATKKCNAANMKQGFIWYSYTYSHPDFYRQYERWYRKGIKQPPRDVRITPKSVMMWYLGDGSLVQSGDSVTLRLSTDGFSEANVEFLARKLRKHGILCHRNNDNRIVVEARGIPAFFKFIGSESPVKCYDYKFKLPEWRFEARRMRDVAVDLGVEYQRLAHLVKTNRLPCYRASDKGRPRFLPEHIITAREFIKAGELY